MCTFKNMSFSVNQSKLIQHMQARQVHSGGQMIKTDWRNVKVFFLLLFVSLSAAAAPSLGLNRFQKVPTDNPGIVQTELDPDALKIDLEKRLALVNQKLAAMPDDDISVQNMAQYVEDNTDNHRRVYLKQMVYMYQGLLARVTNLKVKRNNRIKMENEAKEWSGFKEPVSDPFLQADNLRDTVSKFNQNMDELESVIKITEKAGIYLLSALEASTIKLRQADEALEQAKEGSEQQIFLRHQRDRLELQNQLDLTRSIGVNIEKNLKNETLLEIRSMALLASKQLGELAEKLELTKQELNQATVSIEIEKQRIQDEIHQAIATSESIQQPIAFQTNKTESELAQLKQNRLTQLNNIDIKLQVLNRILGYLDIQREIWGQRWAYVNVTDRKKANEAYALISKNQELLQSTYQYILLHRSQALSELTDQTDIKIAQHDADFEAVLTTLDNLDFDQIISFSRLLRVIQATEQLLERFKVDLDRQFAVKTFQDSFNATWLATVDFLADVWAYELFAVEDTIVVDGQHLTSQRSVTVSKVVTALAILIIGYWIASKLSRYVESLAVTRLHMDVSLARIARRWIFFLEVLLLVIISMLVVRIPLTIFAFMGGAVAIGAGFGMQNLLKNLISGLMLLIERPFRPGDLVEVGSIRGRITDIGVRSSNILDANGIETIIPNSTFIEQNVTNWTLSDQVVRTVIKVGVAYGSSTKETSRILLEEASRHGLVLENPPPQVLFEDFGDDALLFGLYVWVQLKVDVSWKAIASDLRYMINRSLSEHDIVIAFPQRDIHLDTSRPLEVRVVSDAVAASTPVSKQPIGDESAKQQPPHLPG